VVNGLNWAARLRNDWNFQKNIFGKKFTIYFSMFIDLLSVLGTSRNFEKYRKNWNISRNFQKKEIGNSDKGRFA